MKLPYDAVLHHENAVIGLDGGKSMACNPN